jgi:hypothetical protein
MKVFQLIRKLHSAEVVVLDNLITMPSKLCLGVRHSPGPNGSHLETTLSSDASQSDHYFLSISPTPLDATRGTHRPGCHAASNQTANTTGMNSKVPKYTSCMFSFPNKPSLVSDSLKHTRR